MKGVVSGQRGQYPEDVKYGAARGASGGCHPQRIGGVGLNRTTRNPWNHGLGSNNRHIQCVMQTPFAVPNHIPQKDEESSAKSSASSILGRKEDSPFFKEGDAQKKNIVMGHFLGHCLSLEPLSNAG